MAIIEQCVSEIRKHSDGTYSFNKLGYGSKGEVVEYRHFYNIKSIGLCQ